MIFSENFTLHRVFDSHIVLQRRQPIIISGTAEPSKAVQVEFAGQKVIAVAMENHEWFAEFSAMEAGGPYKLKITGTSNSTPVILEDILIGEVWLCIGQSNMEMPVDSTDSNFCVLNSEQVIQEAQNQQIRFYNSMINHTLAPDGPLLEPCGTGWQCCNEQTVKAMSACGYFFGRQLQKDLSIPIGLIAAAWGGTGITAWISQKKFEEKNYFPPVDTTDDILQKWHSWYDSTASESIKKWLQKFDSQGGDGSQYTDIYLDDSEWDDFSQNTVFPFPGRYVCRLSFDLEGETSLKNIKLKLGIVNDVDRTYLNNELIGETGIEQPEYWSAEREYPVKPHCIRRGRNCITVIVDNHYSCGEAAFNLILSADGLEQRIVPQCKMKTIFLLPQDFPLRPAVPTPALYSPNTPNYPSTLFNARLYPWFRYAICGILWYQGCNDNGKYSYYPLHKMLIDDLREHWRRPEMPFILVQLASFHTHTPTARLADELFEAIPFPEFSEYGLTREIQAEMPHVRKNVGMIVAFDRGDHSDIHPRDKETLGFRLAKKAEAMVYGAQQVADGPEFAGLRLEGKAIRVFFHNAKSGLKTTDQKAPVGFVLGDRNGRFYPAKAVIEGNSVVLTAVNTEMIEPQRVRYAFTGYCRVNLVNKEGFPAIPFRSDKPDYEKMFSVNIENH